ncbi:MAG: hypothetical protein IKG25_04400 [Mogibacterium sp.]|nr:hypothetical protein [Mogibacterium sp.]MBR4090191.1 hypothetical protein [Mogibacterium sp.]
MKGKYTYRIINTVITAIGTLFCIVSGFIPAPYGLLSDGTISLIQSLPGSQKAVSFLLPVLLFIAATVIVGAGRYRLGSLITVLAGSCIFALMDLSYIKASMAFTGTLFNELGIVIALSGVLLHAIGTPKSEIPKGESLMKTLDSFLEAELAPETEPATKPESKLAAEPESDVVSKPEAEESVARTGLLKEIVGTDEQHEKDAPAEITPAGNPMTYTQVLQPADAEPEELIEETGDPLTYTQVLQPADAEPEELTEEAGDSMTYTQVMWPADAEPEPVAAESVVSTGLPEETEPTEDIKAYTQVMQPINEEYADLIEEAVDPVKYTQVLWPADAEIEELTAEDNAMTEEAAQKEVHEAAPLENTIVLDADLEDLLINADGQEN